MVSFMLTHCHAAMTYWDTGVIINDITTTMKMSALIKAYCDQQDLDKVWGACTRE